MYTDRLSLYDSGSIAVARALETLKGLPSRALLGVQQEICGLRGHTLLLHFERDRLSLHCASCGWDTPGWTVAPRPSAGAGGRPRACARRAG